MTAVVEGRALWGKRKVARREYPVASGWVRLRRFACAVTDEP
jgi:hypothetical protein